MNRAAATVDDYLAALPDDRRAALQAIRKVIRKNLPRGYQEGMQYGMIGYFVPHSVYPPGYHCDPKQPLPFAGLASQKNHMSLYMTGMYMSLEHEAWFRKAWTADGRKLDMGKACVRFRKLEDVPLEVVGEAVKRIPVKEFIRIYESTRPGGEAGGSQAGKGAKTPKKKGAKTPKKKVAKRTSKKALKEPRKSGPSTAPKPPRKTAVSAGSRAKKKAIARTTSRRKAAK
jgi:hypothetical protein